MANVFHSNYKQLCDKYASVDVSEEVKKKAQVICSRREKYAKAIPVEKISEKVAQGKELIKTIRGLLPKSEDKINAIVLQKCSELEEKLDLYLDEAQKLQKRFKNEKIKIVIFGKKSNAKSTFIQLFTGLDEKVVSVKAPGNDLDLTGATNIISHDTSGTKKSPQIKVYFKSSETLLRELNQSIFNLYDGLKELDPSFKFSYAIWSDFLNDIKTNGKKWFDLIQKLTGESINDFSTKKKTLLQFFDPSARFTYVKSDEYHKDISVEELPMFNNMNNDGERHFLSVNEIRISLDLGNNEMFKLFDICDTKGLSTESGSEYEPILFEQMNSADATFCVQKVGGGQQANEFFGSLADKCLNEKGPKDLDKKLFVVLNKCQGIEQKSVSTVIGDIRDRNLAVGVYEGSLAREINDSTPPQTPFVEDDGTVIDAEKFAKNVMTDMLYEIVKTTQSMDDLLWDRVSITRPIEIEQAVIDLVSAMDYSAIHVSLDLDGMLSKKILEYRTNALKTIESIAKEEKILDSSSNALRAQSSKTKKKVAFKQFGTQEEINNKQESTESDSSQTQVSISQELANPKIYRIITGIKEDKFPSDLKNVDSDTIIERSLDFVSEQIRDNIGKRVRITSGRSEDGGSVITGDVQTVGSFIDDYSALLYDSIEPRINRDWAPPQEIKDYKDFCNLIIIALWNDFKLDVVLGKINSGEDIYKYTTEPRIKVWYNYWKEPHFDKTTDRLPAICSFDILKAFFANSNLEPSDVDIKQLRPLFGSFNEDSWKMLKKAAFTVYNEDFNFKSIVEQKISDIIGTKANAYDAFTANLAEGKIDQDFTPLFKRLPKERLVELKILSEDNLVEIKQAENRNILLAKRDEINIIKDLPQWVKP